MLRRLFWIAVGAALALQADRWFRQQREKLKPSNLTGTLLDKANERLEKTRAQQERGSGPNL
jgi:hypothetical protein